MVRDLSKVMLREFHRPKLPLSVVRLDLAWQFQIRYVPSGKKTETPGTSSSYQSIMMGGHPGSISKAKLRSESDLSPTEGKLILLEYSEERPPLQLCKGMSSKIVNYYRGDKAHCPVSAGGGDRPTRRKRGGDGSTNAKDSALVSRSERMPRLEGPNRETTVIDWVGKLPKKSQKERSEKESIDVLPEGVTELLHPKVAGPFIGEIEEGATLTGLISNLFVAPMFRHDPESTDFLMILRNPGGIARPGQRESMGVVLRDLPSSIFTVGQTEPKTKVHAPNTQGEKNFVGPFVSYQIARALTRSEAREGHGLRFDEIQDRVLPNLELAPNALRQRLKQVAVYDKNTQIWTTKSIGYEDYPGVDALAKSISPEGVAAFETASAASRRLADLGVHQLNAGSHTVLSIGVTMVYLAGQLNATRELSRKMKKLLELSKSNRSISSVQITIYEKAAAELESVFKALRQKHETAQFIYEELQLSPWHLTCEFIDVHKKGEGTGMMKLTGLGDPSGQGEGFSFIREADSKPSKAVGNTALQQQVKKITGTEDDLRKLTMKQMAALLRSYGMAQKQIDTLKRWDRVHVIRDLSTKAASDGIGDGLERFARGEKMKLSEQKV
jgi:transcription initiation factor TFIID subunit 1